MAGSRGKADDSARKISDASRLTMAIDLNYCQNCGSALARGKNYCSHCGQEARTSRLTLTQLWHDLLHALTHVDRSVLSLLRPLLIWPGYVARDYVEGKRKRYFRPLSWLVVIVGLVSAEVVVSGFHVAIANNPSPLLNVLQRHVNLVFLFQVPLLALFCRLLFRRDGFNSAEFLVLAAYTVSVRTLFFGVVLVPLSSIFHPSPTAQVFAAYASFIVWAVYFGFAASQFSTGGRTVASFKGVLAAILTQAATQAMASFAATLWFR